MTVPVPPRMLTPPTTDAVMTVSSRFGGTVDWINLPDIGIKGNGHMMMQDKNNMEIAEVIQKWLASRGLVE